MKLVCKYNEAKMLFDSYGDFHDCRISTLVQNYADKKVEMHLENINAGLVEGGMKPGILIFENIEYSYCQIPFVGGSVVILGVELSEDNNGYLVEFDLTTDEWIDTEVFRNIELKIKAQQVSIHEL